MSMLARFATTGGGVEADPNFSNVTLLLPGDGTNGAQNNTFLDSSTNNFSITRNGNTTQGTFSPYGANWSNYFDGTGDYLTTPSNAAFGFGTGDYTIECWFNVQNQTAGTSTVLSIPDGAGDSLAAYVNTNLYVYSPGLATFNTGVSVTNTWTHVSITRSSGTLRVFVNGALTNSASDSKSWPTTSVVIGATPTPSSLAIGYISNVRILKGTALYTAAFTPPTAPLTAITNTSLLTCQSSRFIDNSANAFTITRSGDVSVQRFSPFSPSDSYDAATIGGSGYFDGIGDYLQAPNNAAFAFGTGNFTLEAWFYAVPPLGNRTILGNLESSVDADTVLGFWLTGTGGIEIATYNTFLYQSASNVVVINQWNHIAICRSGTTDAVWLNGTKLSSWTDTFNYSATNGYRVGAWGSGSYIYKGYISNARIIKGTAVYNPSSATITVPTAPFSSISGTSLLCNFTNAGVIDNVLMNNLIPEIFGTARISTAQSKFGGSSILFPGGSFDYFTAAHSPTQQLGSGDFTIEGWLYVAVLGTGYSLLEKMASGVGGWAVVVTSANKLGLRFTAGSLDGATSLAASTWYHFCIVRSGTASGNVKVYLNGTVDATSPAAWNSDLNQILPLYVGSGPFVGAPFNGYMDDVRITKGVARYTGNFTPPAAPFPLK